MTSSVYPVRCEEEFLDTISHFGQPFDTFGPFTCWHPDTFSHSDPLQPMTFQLDVRSHAAPPGAGKQPAHGSETAPSDYVRHGEWMLRPNRIWV